MESTDGFSQLLEFIFGKKETISDKRVAHSSIPPSLMTEDFSKKLGDVLRMKKKVLFYHFLDFLNEDILSFLSSYEGYVRYVISACFCECESNRNIFEKFIGVCALAMHLSEETLEKTGVDFRDLNPDIIMVFYQNDAIQRPFLKGRDFKKFGEFIRDHRFHRFPAASDSLQPDHKVEEELRRYRLLPEEGKSAMWLTTESMVQEVLSRTSVKLPTLPSKAYHIEELVASRKKDKAKQTERKGQAKIALSDETSHGNSSLNSDPNPNCSAAQQVDIEWCENIVQAVLRHNHSNISHREDAQNPKLVEAEGTLEHLKNSIKSLIEVLDECNQE